MFMDCQIKIQAFGCPKIIFVQFYCSSRICQFHLPNYLPFKLSAISDFLTFKITNVQLQTLQQWSWIVKFAQIFTFMLLIVLHLSTSRSVLTSHMITLGNCVFVFMYFHLKCADSNSYKCDKYMGTYVLRYVGT